MKYFITAALSLVLLASPAKAEEFTKEQIQEIVHDYLINNPEVMMEVMVAVKEHQVVQSLKENQQTIAANNDKLFKDKNSPAIGPDDAKVTLVEFFDYNCGACKIMFNSLDAYLKEDKELRVVFKEYPIFGETSEYPARLAIAVYRTEPEKYFEFHSALMKYQGRVNAEVADGILKKLGLDAEEIKKEAASDDVKKEIDSTHALAKALKATGTPMVVMNEEIIPHALDLDTLREKVAEHGK